MNAGYLLNTLLPFRMGEIGRAMLLRSSGLGFWQVIPSILMERALDFLIALGMFLGALPFVLQIPQGAAAAVFLGTGVLLGMLMLFIMARKQEAILAWITGRGSGRSDFWEWVAVRLERFLSGLEVMQDGRRFLKVCAWMLFSWVIALGYQYLLLLAFLPESKLIWAVFALGVLAMGVTIPSTPGNLGVYEAALIAALIVWGVSGPDALAYALVSHAIVIGVTALFGTYALYREGLALRDVFVYRKLTDENKEGEI
jgi:uncharacterized protein (TIRG00374 family)